MAQLKILYFVGWSWVKLSSTWQKIFVRLQTSLSLQLPCCFKYEMLSLMNLMILKKHQSYQDHLRFTNSHDVLPLQPEKPKSIFSSYWIAKNLVVPENMPPKKAVSTWTVTLIFSRSVKACELTSWKKTWVLMKTKISRGAPCVCNGFMKRALNSGFWLINLSDGLVLLIFVLDLRVDNFLLIFFFF